MEFPANNDTKRQYLQKQQRLLGILRNNYAADIVPEPRDQLAVVVPGIKCKSATARPSLERSRSSPSIREKITKLRKISEDNAKNLVIRSSTAPTITSAHNLGVQPPVKHIDVETRSPLRPSSRLYPRSLTAPVARLQQIQDRFLQSVKNDPQVVDEEQSRMSALTYAAVIAAIKDSQKRTDSQKPWLNKVKPVHKSERRNSQTSINGIAGFGANSWRVYPRKVSIATGVPGVITVKSTAKALLCNDNDIQLGHKCENNPSCNSFEKNSAFSKQTFSLQHIPSPSTSVSSPQRATAPKIQRKIGVLNQHKPNDNYLENFLHCTTAHTHPRYRKIVPARCQTSYMNSFIPPQRKSRSADCLKQVHLLKYNEVFDKPKSNRSRDCRNIDQKPKERSVRFSTDENRIYEYELNEPLSPGIGNTLELRKTLDMMVT